METMEEYKVVRIINEEPEFMEVQEANVSANFLFCVKRETNFLEKKFLTFKFAE